MDCVNSAADTGPRPDPHSDYRELYGLQDRILDTVFSTESEFYLTGGTCISRFYKAKRYSDDLDFFTHQSPRFAFAIRNIVSELRKTFTVNTKVETKNFVRLNVESRLQVDFVNDIAYRHKDPVVTERGYLIDTIENILANKLNAVTARDNPKDIFDIVLIYHYYTFSWREVLSAAHKKAGFSDEELIIRLKSFPREMLNQIKCIDCDFLKHFETDLSEIIQAILNK